MHTILKPVCLVAFFIPSLVFAQDQITQTYGHTAVESCATLTQNLSADSAAKIIDLSWINGFWSGLNLNSDKNPTTGHTTDNAGVDGEIELYCRNHPSDVVTTAVYKTWLNFVALKK